MVMDEDLQICDKTWRPEEPKMPNQGPLFEECFDFKLNQKDEATGGALSLRDLAGIQAL
jgi:hypothetical protein